MPFVCVSVCVCVCKHDILLFMHNVSTSVHTYICYRITYMCKLQMCAPVGKWATGHCIMIWMAVYSSLCCYAGPCAVSMARTLWRSCAQRTTSTVWNARRKRPGTSGRESGQEEPLQVCTSIGGVFLLAERVHFCPHGGVGGSQDVYETLLTVLQVHLSCLEGLCSLEAITVVITNSLHTYVRFRIKEVDR